METLIKEKMLEQFTRQTTNESATIQPINVGIKQIPAQRIIVQRTLVSNDKNYYIRYGGFVSEGSYNAIEVYSISSIDNGTAVYIFNNITISGNSIQLTDLKQAEDGRFYGIGRYLNGGINYYYLIIFNNFIQDGILKINKVYSASEMEATLSATSKVIKKGEEGIYFLIGQSSLYKFEIDIVEGNKISSSNIIDNSTVNGFSSEIAYLKDKIILTRLHYDEETYQIDYEKIVVDATEDLPEDITLQSVYTKTLTASTYINPFFDGSFKIIVPYIAMLFPGFYVDIVDFNGNITTLRADTLSSNFTIQLRDKYVLLNTANKIELFFIDYENSTIFPFYQTNQIVDIAGLQILEQFNISALIGVNFGTTTPNVISIKNIYSPGVTSTPYYRWSFAEPYYLNLYSSSSENNSIFFSRDTISRFYTANQITTTFVVPNYLLNEGNINRADIYGTSNYLITQNIQNYPKNKFESLYFNFIYNLNVIDNTNNLNVLNQNGSNRAGSLFWERFDNPQAHLAKARITYDDFSTEIINLDIPTPTGTSVTFSFQVTGNVTKIEYLSNDESTVYATFRTNLSGTNTITQTVRVE